jgi:hypothetical protein
MNTRAFSWHTLYLRWAGLVSACLGALSLTAFILGWLRGVAGNGMLLSILGIVGTIVCSVIAKDILDRSRNHETNGNSISVNQQKFAWIGTRFGFAFLAILAIIMSIILLGAFVIGPAPIHFEM